jgi:transketolase
MAMAERWLAHRFNRPATRSSITRTFCLVGDGDLMEDLLEAGSSRDT